MKFREKFLKFFAKNKFRFNRGYSYFALLGVPILVADVIQRRLIPYGIAIPMYGLIIMAGILVWLSGYVEDKMGVLSAESEYSFQRNPAWTERNNTNLKKEQTKSLPNLSDKSIT